MRVPSIIPTEACRLTFTYHGLNGEHMAGLHDSNRFVFWGMNGLIRHPVTVDTLQIELRLSCRYEATHWHSVARWEQCGTVGGCRDHSSCAPQRNCWPARASGWCCPALCSGCQASLGGQRKAWGFIAFLETNYYQSAVKVLKCLHWCKKRKAELLPESMACIRHSYVVSTSFFPPSSTSPT